MRKWRSLRFALAFDLKVATRAMKIRRFGIIVKRSEILSKL